MGRVKILWFKRENVLVGGDGLAVLASPLSGEAVKLD
jgi:hypothetical protein